MLQTILKRIKKLTVVDYVIFLVVLLGAVYFSKNVFIKMDYILVDVDDVNYNDSADVIPESFWKVSDLKVGDSVYNSFGKKTAEVTKVDGNAWWPGNRVQTHLTLKVWALYDWRQKVYLMDGNPLRTGDPIKLTFGEKQFSGLVRNVYEKESDKWVGWQKASAEVTIRLRGYEVENLNRLKKFTVTDFEGNVLLKVIGMKTTLAEEYVQMTNGVEINLGKDLKKMDADITVEMPEVWCRNEICYYNNDQTFVVGDEFWAVNGDTGFGRNSVIIDRKITYETN